MFRALARRCHIPPWEAGRLTISQAFALLSNEDPDDPHRGNVPIESHEDLLAACEGYL